MMKLMNLQHSEIQVMGQKGVEIIKEKYTIEIFLDKFLKIIRWKIIN